MPPNGSRNWGAVEREAVDGTVVQVCQIPVLGSLSRVWLLL